MKLENSSSRKIRWGYILLVMYNVWGTASSQATNPGYCGRYTCERDQGIRENVLMKCISDQPLSVRSRINETVPSVYDCVADLHVMKLQYGVTICSNVPQTHIMDVRPNTQAALDLLQLYRLIDTVSRDSGNTNSKCFLKDIQLPRGIKTQPSRSGVANEPIKTPHQHYYSKNVLIGAVVGAFVGGVLVATIILLSIYFCCVRDKKDKIAQISNPAENHGYQHDSNGNLSEAYGHSQKDWSREQHNRINRMNGMIDAYSYGDTVDPYASIEDAQPVRQVNQRKESEDNISAMYSIVDMDKKKRNKTQTAEDVDREAFSFPNSSGPYYALEEDSFSSDPGQNTSSATIQTESNAESGEIVPPENGLHYYHVLEKSVES